MSWIDDNQDELSMAAYNAAFFYLEYLGQPTPTIVDLAESWTKQFPSRLIEGIAHFYQSRGYITKKQRHCICIYLSNNIDRIEEPLAPKELNH